MRKLTDRCGWLGKVRVFDHIRWHQVHELAEGPDPDSALDKACLRLRHVHRLLHLDHADGAEHPYISDTRGAATAQQPIFQPALYVRDLRLPITLDAPPPLPAAQAP